MKYFFTVFDIWFLLSSDNVSATQQQRTAFSPSCKVVQTHLYSWNIRKKTPAVTAMADTDFVGIRNVSCHLVPYF